MQVTFNLGRQVVHHNRWTKSSHLPTNTFYYDKKRTAQKHTQLRVEAPVAGKAKVVLRVAQVIFDKNIPEEMDPVWRTQVMENVVALCEVKWQEMYGK